MNDDDNWLLTTFAQAVYPTALLIYEHANPPEEVGFVTSVDLYVGSAGGKHQRHSRPESFAVQHAPTSARSSSGRPQAPVSLG